MAPSEVINLPNDYFPPNDVAVLGRGKRYIKHPGNQKLRGLVQSELPAYLAAFNRKDKSAIILRVLQVMRHNSESNVGLVRHDTLTGQWSLVDDGTARVSIAQLFRDALSVYYKSSKQHKQKLRRENKVKRMASDSSADSEGSVGGEEEGEDEMPSLDSFQPLPVTVQSHGSKDRLRRVLQDSQEMIESLAAEEFSVVSRGDSVQDHPGPVTPLPEDQLFDRLFQVFGKPAASATVNPFEPTPMCEIPMDVMEPCPLILPEQDNFFFKSGNGNAMDTTSLQELFLWNTTAENFDLLPSGF